MNSAGLVSRAASWALLSVLLAAVPVYAQIAEPVAAPAAIPPAPAAAPAAPAPQRLRPYRDVLRDSKAIPGFFTLHRKDEKVWLEIRPEQFEQPFFFAFNIPRSIGERGLFGGQMGRSHIAFFRRAGERVQLIARNEEFFAAQGTPQAAFVAESFSDSLLASAAFEAQPDPASKAVIIDASAILFGDIPGYLTRLETAFRLPYALDRANTAFAQVNNHERLTGLNVRSHFTIPKLPAPPAAPPSGMQMLPPPPRVLPDPRSLFVNFYYSFTPLPETPLAPRLADQRIGHFTTSRVDYTDDTAIKARVQYIRRWRLEKTDPAAALSEPKQPLVYWLDKNIPEKYREAVTAGVLEWNKAFERIGFQNALVVKQQGAQDDFDTMDARHASIRWFTGIDVGFAIGPSQVDPRSGEILDADIGMSDVFAKNARRVVLEDIGRSTASHVGDPLAAHDEALACNYAAEAAHEQHFALDLLEARGLAPDSAAAEAVVQAYVKAVIMHEVGHTLGLRHNFRASTAYSLNRLRDPAFTRERGIAASVMDYTPFNLAAAGEAQADYVQTSLGVYDYWAIEYAYRPLAAEEERTALAAIAARSTEPGLAYGTDEDAGGIRNMIGIDPDVNRFDLGPDPLAYYERRMQLARELWARTEALQLAPGENYERLTRSLVSGFRAVAQVAPLAAKFVGGVTHRRDLAGSGRPVYEPTPAVKQRAALNLITRDFFSAASFRFSPALLSRIGIDYFDRPANPLLSVAEGVLNIQKSVLDHLLSDLVAARLLDSRDRVADGAKVLPLTELYDTLQWAIWSELKSGAEPGVLRRNLQREHLRRVVNALLRPSAASPADAVGLLRENARSLAAALRTTQARPALDRETRAHYAQSLNVLEEALKAPLQRGGA